MLYVQFCPMSTFTMFILFSEANLFGGFALRGRIYKDVTGGRWYPLSSAAGWHLDGVCLAHSWAWCMFIKCMNAAVWPWNMGKTLLTKSQQHPLPLDFWRDLFIIWKAERYREVEIFHPWILFTKGPQQARLGLAKTRNLKLHLHLLHGRQEPKHLGHHPPPFQVC